MIHILPLLISFFLGLALVNALLKNRLPGPLLTLFLSAVTGLGLSGFLTFTSFICFNRLVPWFVIGLNIAALLALAPFAGINALTAFRRLTLQDAAAIGVLVALMIPMIVFASLYPNGGWDAWGFWNTKARFLFLGGTEWTRMFDPVIWRTEIVYPFLLPLIHVWIWSFGPAPTATVPMAMTCLIPFLTAGMLFAVLNEITGHGRMLLVPAWLFSGMFVVTLSASQYCDLLLGLFLMTALSLFSLFQRTRASGYLVLMGLVLGFASFTKVEGSALAMITATCALVLILTDSTARHDRGRAATLFAAATAAAALPLVIFMTGYAPQHGINFTNGLLSTEHPASWDRLRAVLAYYFKEFTGEKWNALWLGLGGILALSGRKIFSRSVIIIPAVIGLYALTFTTMYTINTFYPAPWWLDTSLNRIIFATAPSLALWAFLSAEST